MDIKNIGLGCCSQAKLTSAEPRTLTWRITYGAPSRETNQIFHSLVIDDCSFALEMQS